MDRASDCMKGCRITRASWNTSTSTGYRGGRSVVTKAMPDRHFSDPRLAALYDLFCAGRPDFDFYLPLVMSAGSVLDVGCGTGALLHLARQAGHTGRLCGLDPADGMLQRAQKRSDIEWVHGTLASARWH